MIFKKLWKMLFVLSLLLFIPILVFATNGSISDAGAASIALAGSDVALPQDAMSGAINPASLVAVGSRADLSLALFSPHRKYNAVGLGNVASGEHVSGSNYHPLPSFAFSRALGNHNAAGVAIYAHGGMNTDYPASANVFGGGAAGINFQQMFADFTYAHQFKQLALGASLLTVGQTINVRGLSAFAPFTVTGMNSKLTNEGTNLSVGVGVKLGAIFTISPKLQLAATYHPKVLMSKFNRYANLFAQSGSLDVPPTAEVGLAWHPIATMAVTADVKRIWNSAVPAMHNAISNFNRCMAGDRSYCLGGSNGPGFGWRDMTVYSVGWRWQANSKWTWRAGVSYAKQPIPKDQVVFNILAPATVETHFALGVTRKIARKYALTIYGQFVPRKSIKGNNYFAPSQQISLSMYQYLLGFSWSWL